MVDKFQDRNGIAIKRNNSNIMKFLCSFGGKILPRSTDGKLRYVGGQNRILAVDRSISFSELLLKLEEMYGSSVSLRCQLPSEDLDALVTITSDEDLANIIEEYGRANPSLKIRAFLSSPKSIKKISPTPSETSSSSVVNSASPKSSSTVTGFRSFHPSDGCVRQMLTVIGYPLCSGKVAGKLHCYAYHAPQIPSHIYVVHNGS